MSLMMACRQRTNAAPGSTVVRSGANPGQLDVVDPSEPHDDHDGRVTVGREAVGREMLAELDRASATACGGGPTPERLRNYFRIVAGSRILGPVLAEVPCPGTIRRRVSSDLEVILLGGLRTGAFSVQDHALSVGFAFNVLRAISGDQSHATCGPVLRGLQCARWPTPSLDGQVGMLLKAWGHPG